MRYFELFDPHPRREPTTIRFRLPDFSTETRPANSPTVCLPSVIAFSANTLSIRVQSLLQLVAALGTALATVQAVEPGADEFYQNDKVQTIHLTISQENLKRMHDALPERIYVPGTFRWEDAKL